MWSDDSGPARQLWPENGQRGSELMGGQCAVQLLHSASCHHKLDPATHTHTHTFTHMHTQMYNFHTHTCKHTVFAHADPHRGSWESEIIPYKTIVLDHSNLPSFRLGRQIKTPLPLTVKQPWTFAPYLGHYIKKYAARSIQHKLHLVVTHDPVGLEDVGSYCLFVQSF